MRLRPLPGRQIPRSPLSRLSLLGTGSASRFPPLTVVSPTLPRRHEQPSLHGSTGTLMVPLGPASQPTRPECVLHKRARSAGVGKRRYAVPFFMPVTSELNQMVYSVMENPHARGAQLEGCLVSMPGSVECEDRTKSRARTVIGKKIRSTLSGNRRPILHFLQPFRTFPSVSPLPVPHSQPRVSNIRSWINCPTITWELITGIKLFPSHYPSPYSRSTATAKQSALPS